MCKTCDGKLNRKSNKERRLKKSKEKCPEHREKTKELPKCPRPKRSPPAKAKKCLTRIEKIMLRIQPPIADRERYLHHEHVNCFLEESERVYITKPKCAPCPIEREKVCNEDKKKKKKKKAKKTTGNENVEGEKANDETTDNEGQKDAEFSPAKQEGEENIEDEGDKQGSDDSKAKSQAKKTKKMKNKKNRKRKEDIEEDSDETSICSNDSKICLVGLGLTKEDKKNIEENRRKVHPSSDNKENNAESGENVQEVSEQEGEDNK